MTRETVLEEYRLQSPCDPRGCQKCAEAMQERMAAELATLRAQLAGVRERATPDVVRILRLLSDEKSRPITLHIGYGQQLAAMADVLAALDGAA